MSKSFRFVRLALLALSLSVLAAPVPARDAGSGAAATTVIFVRHAEKAAEPKDDPPLSDAGRARADALARVTSVAGVSAVVTSQFARTKQTAAPVAARLGLTPVAVAAEVDPATRRLTPAALAALVAEIRKHAGATVLVVGHSNTVPDAIKALGGPDVTVDETAFDDMFVVTVVAEGRASVVRLKYGA
jgi:broad specificity phosphatase PhoE